MIPSLQSFTLSPDSQWIVYSSPVYESYNTSIQRVRIDGSDTPLSLASDIRGTGLSGIRINPTSEFVSFYRSGAKDYSNWDLRAPIDVVRLDGNDDVWSGSVLSSIVPIPYSISDLYSFVSGFNRIGQKSYEVRMNTAELLARSHYTEWSDIYRYQGTYQYYEHIADLGNISLNNNPNELQRVNVLPRVSQPFNCDFSYYEVFPANEEPPCEAKLGNWDVSLNGDFSVFAATDMSESSAQIYRFDLGDLDEAEAVSFLREEYVEDMPPFEHVDYVFKNDAQSILTLSNNAFIGSAVMRIAGDDRYLIYNEENVLKKLSLEDGSLIELGEFDSSNNSPYINHESNVLSDERQWLYFKNSSNASVLHAIAGELSATLVGVPGIDAFTYDASSDRFFMRTDSGFYVISNDEAPEDLPETLTPNDWGEWTIRFTVSSEEDGLVDDDNYYGVQNDAVRSRTIADNYDLADPFVIPQTGPYLNLGFGGHWNGSGPYRSRQVDHARTNSRGVGQRSTGTTFTILTDKVGREITITWEAPYGNECSDTPFERMRLYDRENKVYVQAESDGELNSYTFTSNRLRHRFVWHKRYSLVRRDGQGVPVAERCN